MATPEWIKEMNGLGRETKEARRKELITEVGRLTGLGMSREEIAEQLGISISTVRTYRQEAGVRSKHSTSNVSASAVNVVGRLINQLALLAEQIDVVWPLLDDYDIDPKRLASWEEALTRRGNPGAVIKRLRQAIKEHHDYTREADR